MIVVENGQRQFRRYWQMRTVPRSDLNEKEWISNIRVSLAESVERQMVSDVPLGAFLSGGIDSSAIVAYMRQARPDGCIRTYSIGYQNSTGAEYYNELDHARQVAKEFNTEHHEILVDPDIVSLLPRLVWQLDEPTSDAALVTTSLVAEYASSSVKVILSGVGGDEMWGGYDRYLVNHYLCLLNRLPRWLRSHFLAPMAKVLPVDRHSAVLNVFRYVRTLLLLSEQHKSHVYHQLMEIFSKDQLSALLNRRPVSETDVLHQTLELCAENESLNQIFTADATTQLTDDLLLLSDKMTMAHSLECRVPLLDEQLVDLASSVPPSLRINGRRTRYILRKALKDVIPEWVIARKKRGFGPPIGGWFKYELAPVVDRLLSKKNLARGGMLNWQAVSSLVSEHRSNKADHTERLFALVTLELWRRLFLEKQSVEDVTAWLMEPTNSG
jgi:asparagine synthase (glutamine-hydrolysing)